MDPYFRKEKSENRLRGGIREDKEEGEKGDRESPQCDGLKCC